MAGGYYKEGLFQQLQETIARLEEVEKQRKIEAAQLRQIIDAQAKQMVLMSKEIQLLREYNDCLRSILNNNSGNSPQPLYRNQKKGIERTHTTGEKKAADAKAE